MPRSMLEGQQPSLRLNYVTSTFLLVSPSVRSKQLLCFVQGQGKKNERKHTKKTLSSFITIHTTTMYGRKTFDVK